jgi:polar amino acid transport system substrate-binding protein
VSEGDLLARLKRAGTVRLGIAGEVPYGFIDKNGEFTGEAPELAKVIFKRLGVDSVQPVEPSNSMWYPLGCTSTRSAARK